MGLDGIWQDDFHHVAIVAAGGKREGYYRAFQGSAEELVAVTQGPLRDPGGIEPAQLVTFLQNHDQIAHSARGFELHAADQPGALAALSAFLLLSPGTPLLFMGQEFAASSPFLFFADHEPALAALVRRGRAGRCIAQFESVADPAMQALLDDPGSPDTFARCRLDPGERARHPEAMALHSDLLQLRRCDTAFSAQQAPRGHPAGALALALRFVREDGLDRLLLLNLGHDQSLADQDDDVLTAPAGAPWTYLVVRRPGVPAAAARPRRRARGSSFRRSRRWSWEPRAAPEQGGSSRLSHSACQLASMMFSEQPTVLQRSSPRADSISTRGLAAVPRCSSTMRTL